MEDFLRFKKMLTPVFIQILFWIGLAVTTVFGLVMIIQGATSHYGGGSTVIFGLVWLILGPIIVRVNCEILIVIFSINDTLTDIRNSLKQKQ